MASNIETAIRKAFPNCREFITPEMLAALDREAEEWRKVNPMTRVYVGSVTIPLNP